MRARILAHRGYWLDKDEKNREVAFHRALDCGFGIETDVRDLDGELVISHDPPHRGTVELSVAEFFSAYAASDARSWLALNIKADGLAESLQKLLEEFAIKRYFVFDMSIPDMRSYVNLGMTVFTRRSDLEPVPALYDRSAGVWLDALEAPFLPADLMLTDIANGKMTALVSPELHKRPHQEAWSSWRSGIAGLSGSGFFLCTDLPNEALEFWSSGQ